MELHEIDAALLKRAFLAGAQNLDAKKEWINELNVFPVPDGDTGTNMTLTILSAAKEVSEMENPGITELCKAISSGSLRGARGNSGVILSQLLRGFTKVIRETESINTEVLAAAFQRATETAYKAVMKPKEGTILTVARGMNEKAAEIAQKTDDILVFAEAVIQYGDEVLEKTPDMLPVLKQAGVVDSGGQGLMTVMKGALNGLKGLSPDLGEILAPQTASPAAKKSVDTSNLDTSEIRFGYCTEFIVNLEKEFTDADERSFKAYLESIGDSIVCVADDDVVKVHVHTNDPGLAIQKGLSFGSLSKMKIDNMREEHNERLIKDADRLAAQQKEEAEKKEKAAAPRKPFGFVCVSVGDGLSEIFKGVGADCLIEGGQTMNPSTEDVLNAINSVNADTVFVLPNNKNIILAAEQAKSLVEDKNVVVVPSKNIPQGITAMINFMPDSSAEENLLAMKEAMSALKSGEITYAVRNTSIDGFEIHEGDIMAIGDSGMLSVDTSVDKAVLNALKNMITEDSELVSLYYGNEVSREDAESLADTVAKEFPLVETELHDGGQPVYYYFLSVE